MYLEQNFVKRWVYFRKKKWNKLGDFHRKIAVFEEFYEKKFFFERLEYRFLSVIKGQFLCKFSVVREIDYSIEVSYVEVSGLHTKRTMHYILSLGERWAFFCMIYRDESPTKVFLSASFIEFDQK